MSTAKQQGKGSPSKSGEQGGRRTLAEWITFGISVFIVTGMISLILLQFREGGEDVVIVVEPQVQSIRKEGSQYYLPVSIKNNGGKTVENVWVEVTLEIGQEKPETRQFTIDFLAGNSEEQGVAVFRQDPGSGRITSQISYVEP